MKSILNWCDDRTGYRNFIHEALFERIPGGARWRYVWGSTLVFTFTVQMITGLFLWMAYSPSSQTAWESVFYIQHDMQFGWLLRGIHHFTAQMMIVLLALHLMQVIIDGAYKAPREVNFWLGLILMKITLGLSLTGYLLPWDQKGYWATKVATKLIGSVPFVGSELQKIVVGGPNYGHHTLTRFFALHAGLLPALLIGFLVLHIYVFRRHGITVHDATRKPDTTFWPDQVLKDAVACLGVLAVVLVLVFWGAPLGDLGQVAQDGRLGETLGADLGAPADPSESYDARPEWYFLFLFQFLKYFPGETEIIGAIVIPGAVFLVLFLMPFIGRWQLGHRFNIAYLSVLLLGASFLTYQAIQEDLQNDEHKLAVAGAEVKAHRVAELIKGGQFEGYQPARVLLQSDPKTRGPAVFERNCSACHRFDDHDGTGKKLESVATASDLGQFGTRGWIRGFIENPAGPKHFGPTLKGSFNGEPIEDRFTAGEMVDWANDNIPHMEKREIDGVVEFLLAQSKRTDISQPDPALVEIGKNFWLNGSVKKVKNEEGQIEDLELQACSECHKIRINGEDLSEGYGEGYPTLTGYASEEWLRDFLLNPGAEQHYGSEKNAMPSYKGRMSEKDLEILIRWMRHRWYEPDEKNGKANH